MSGTNGNGKVKRKRRRSVNRLDGVGEARTVTMIDGVAALDTGPLTSTGACTIGFAEWRKAMSGKKPRPIKVKKPPEVEIKSIGYCCTTDGSHEIVLSPPKVRKVAIVGKAPSSKDLAPYDDESWEIWGVGDLGMHVKRITRSFEVHDLQSGFKRWNDGYTGYLRAEHEFPIYVFEKHPEVKSAVAYPRREILDEFGPLMVDNEGKELSYFTNSIAWMLALAIYEGVQEIGLWGVDMAQHGVGLLSEYAHQRPSCEFWMGVAVGRGIKVMVHQHSDLLKTPYQYGFDSEPSALRLLHSARDGDLQNGLKKAANKTKEVEYKIRQRQTRVEYLEKRLLGVVGEIVSPAIEGMTEEQRKTLEKWLTDRMLALDAERLRIVDMIAAEKAEIAGLNQQKDEQVQKQLVHMGAQEDMQYWHQHHFTG